MKRSWGAVIVLILLLSAVLVTIGPAHALFSFPVFGSVPLNSVSIDNKAQSDDVALSRSIAIGEGYNGKSFGAQKGEVLVVQLKETDPAQSWHYTGQGSFAIIDETVLKSFPALHDFRVRVRGPGDLMFAKVDSRSGDVVERFGVHVVIEEPKPKGDIITRYPLYDFNAIDFFPGMLSLWR
ncbi:MAG: hypothetical protein WBZ29_13180 [Methanocella sp.]